MKLKIFVLMLLLTHQAGKFIIIENANNKKPRSCIFAVPDPGLCFVGSLVNQSLCMAAVWARTKSPLSRAARRGSRHLRAARCAGRRLAATWQLRVF